MFTRRWLTWRDHRQVWANDYRLQWMDSPARRLYCLFGLQNDKHAAKEARPETWFEELCRRRILPWLGDTIGNDKDKEKKNLACFLINTDSLNLATYALVDV
ncbi:hypothetical protein FRC19_002826 [Serendipita sp. 401]|nr:hypothetical protein FRC19_002826 [Serendipita sp. 401]KAG8845302.1 hypothetical protein FRC20_003259 [Serendipita sp. 405]